MNAFKMVELYFVITLSKRIHNLEIYWLNIFVWKIRVSCKIKVKNAQHYYKFKNTFMYFLGTFGAIRQKSWTIKKIGIEWQ